MGRSPTFQESVQTNVNDGMIRILYVHSAYNSLTHDLMRLTHRLTGLICDLLFPLLAAEPAVAIAKASPTD